MSSSIVCSLKYVDNQFSSGSLPPVAINASASEKNVYLEKMAEVHRDNVRASASTSSGLLDPVPPPVLQEQTAMDISPSKKADGYSSSSSKSTKLKDSRSGHRSKQLHFPLSRVRTIMKCAPDISNINQECVYVMTRATVSCKCELC